MSIPVKVFYTVLLVLYNFNQPVFVAMYVRATPEMNVLKVEVLGFYFTDESSSGGVAGVSGLTQHWPGGPTQFWLRTIGERGALMSSLLHSANPCCWNVQPVVSCWKDCSERTRFAHISASYLILFSIWEIPQPNYAWNAFGGIGVEMQRRTSSPQQEPCPVYIASKSMTSCFISYDFDMREICSESNEEWRHYTSTIQAEGRWFRCRRSSPEILRI